MKPRLHITCRVQENFLENYTLAHLNGDVKVDPILWTYGLSEEKGKFTE